MQEKSTKTNEKNKKKAKTMRRDDDLGYFTQQKPLDLIMQKIYLNFPFWKYNFRDEGDLIHRLNNLATTERTQLQIDQWKVTMDLTMSSISLCSYHICKASNFDL